MAEVLAAPTLHQRVAALEEMLANPPRVVFPPVPEFTLKQEAELAEAIGAALKAGPHEYKVIPRPPPLTRDEVRQLLRECVTVVGPGETLVIRDRNWIPSQVNEIQRWMDDEHESGRISFKVLALIGEEMAVTEAGGEAPGAA